MRIPFQCIIYSAKLELHFDSILSWDQIYNYLHKRTQIPPYTFDLSTNQTLIIFFYMYALLLLLHMNVIMHTKKSFLSLVNSSQVGFKLHFSDRFSTKPKSVWYQINLKMLITIQIWIDLMSDQISFTFRMEKNYIWGPNYGPP